MQDKIDKTFASSQIIEKFSTLCSDTEDKGLSLFAKHLIQITQHPVPGKTTIDHIDQIFFMQIPESEKTFIHYFAFGV